jgi:hypothetical protein
MISGYLEELGQRLSFDRALSRSVLREVEDHLYEAIAADPAHDRLEAERSAVANFGDAQVLANQFAAISLMRQTRWLGVGLVLAIVAVLATMKARVAWYGFVQWTLGDDARALGAVVLSIDRWAFWSAAVIGTAALLYIARCHAPASLNPGSRRQLRRAFQLCAVATASLLISVTSDGVLTGLQVGTTLCAQSAIPIISMIVEIACAGTVTLMILRTVRRASAMEIALR